MMRRLVRRWWALVLTMILGVDAHAAGSLERLADDLARAGAPSIAALASGATLALTLRATDDATRKGGRLTASLAPLLRERLSMARRVVDLGGAGDKGESPSISAAREGADVLLVVDLAISRGYLHAIARISDVRRDFWSRLVRPVVGTRSQWYGRARLDGELRGLLGLAAVGGRFGLRPLFPCDDMPAGSVTGCVPTGGALPEPVVAGAVLDLDGDAQNEVALVGLDAVWVARIIRDERRFEAESIGGCALPSGADAGPAPLEPFGFAQAADLDNDGADELVAWSPTRRVAAVLRSSAGGVLVRRWASPTRSCGAARTAGSPMTACGPPLAVWEDAALRGAGETTALPAVVTGEVAPGKYQLEPRFRFWSMRPDERSFTTAAPLWAWADAEALVGGIRARWTATVDARGQLAVAGPARPFSVADAGSAVILADLDDDGVPELVRATSADPDMPDAVVVHSLATATFGQERFRSASASVRAFAAGDLDNDGRLDVLVITSHGLSVLSLEGPEPGSDARS